MTFSILSSAFGNEWIIKEQAVIIINKSFNARIDENGKSSPNSLSGVSEFLSINNKP